MLNICQKMNVSGKTFFNKVRCLRPELSTVITPEILDKVCDEPSVQPFLQWFCENVNFVNVLSNEEVQIMNKLEKEDKWLEGPELDLALEEATRHCPDLLKIVNFDDTDINDLYAEFEIAKDSRKEDESYIRTLQNGIENLRKLDVKLDEDIEKQEESMNRESIEADKAYEECSVLLKDLDVHNHEFFQEVEDLLNVYADTAENKSPPLLWSQMPLELFIKKIELYNHYLDVHIKRQFGNADKEEQNLDSNYVSLITNSQEICMDNERLQELSLCKAILTNSKIDEILAKAQEESYIAILNYVQDIYNSGVLKIPRHSELRTEISELTKKRDFLEENVSLLQERQLTEVVQQFSAMEITKILKQDAQARLERAKHHLDKLKNLLFFAREHGHVRTDLLRMLMEMEFHRLNDICEFAADARYYLKKEYILSSTRCESMQQQQNEYSTTVMCSPNEHNSFHKLFTSMICGGDNAQPLHVALDKYNELLGENKCKKEYILETYLKSKIDKLVSMESGVNSQYMNELKKGSTHTFKLVPYDIETCHAEALAISEKVHGDLTKIRNQIKERLKANINLEREKDILWQRFLVDPDTLRKTYNEVKQMANQCCFGDTSRNEQIV